MTRRSAGSSNAGKALFRFSRTTLMRWGKKRQVSQPMQAAKPYSRLKGTSETSRAHQAERWRTPSGVAVDEPSASAETRLSIAPLVYRVRLRTGRLPRRGLGGEHAAELGREPALDVVDHREHRRYDDEGKGGGGDEPADHSHRHRLAEGGVAAEPDRDRDHAGDHRDRGHDDR